MRVDDIPYPYWENVARYREGRMMYVAFWQWILAGGLFLIVFINLMWFLTTHKPTKEKFDKFVDDLDRKRRAKRTKNITFMGEDIEPIDDLEPEDSTAQTETDNETIEYVYKEDVNYEG